MKEMNFELFYKIHACMPRQGPGDRRSTEKAYRLMRSLPKKPAILDIGCGPGKQTIDLLEISDCTITAVDNHRPYLDRLEETARVKGLAHRMKITEGDMANLIFEDGSFDVVWAEGSIFIIGFENGLVQWKRLLKPGGFMAVSELTRLRPDPPKEAKEFWEGAYPAMQDTESNEKSIEEAGYEPIGRFTLPEESWWKGYYDPLQERVRLMRET
ncbi:MAG: class I SAM-dependent methyltransferase, partial [Spirochaetes bacterium]|nr:class I SAM-dependent methyltransferase [Spirochaetota bacterium]